MALHQYIGARYVPIFYQNSLDPTSTEWEPNVSYEPLVIVTLPNLHSYVSKKYVPDSIGSPALNAEYWYDQGYANAYIQAIQDQIDDMKDGTIPGSIQNQLNTLTTDLSEIPEGFWHNKKVVVYGDSLSTIATNYWQYMVEKDPTIDITNRAVGGSTAHQGLNLIQAATDLSDFDILVFAFLTNDWTADNSLRTLTGYYINMINAVHTQAPETQIVCVFPFYSYYPSFGVSGINGYGYSLADYCNEMAYTVSMYGGIAINLYTLAGVNQYNYQTLLDNAGGRYVHQLEPLGRRIADIMLRFTPTPHPSSSFTFIPGTSNPSNGIVVVKMGNYVSIFQRGTLLESDLTAMNLAELAPANKMDCVAWGQTNHQLCLVSLNYTGVFTVQWVGTADNGIRGIHLSGIIGNLQPH